MIAYRAEFGREPGAGCDPFARTIAETPRVVGLILYYVIAAVFKVGLALNWDMKTSEMSWI